jgi:hypothetical protein
MIDQCGQPSGNTWCVYREDGGIPPKLFSGSLQEVVAHINALHRVEGVSFAAREVKDYLIGRPSPDLRPA